MPSIASAVTFALFTAVAACSSSSSTGGGANDTDGGSGAHDASSTSDSASNAPDGAAQSDASTAADAAPSGSTLTIKIPSTFAGQTRQLSIVTEGALPPMGPPAGVLYQENSPTVTAGEMLHLTLDTSGASGDYYLLVVLYMQGGGMFTPKAGVDYQAASTTKLHFDGKKHDLGELDLALTH